jgi:hypothetical protein
MVRRSPADGGPGRGFAADDHALPALLDHRRAPYPPRTMVEVRRLFDDMIVEIDSIFYAPVKK